MQLRFSATLFSFLTWLGGWQAWAQGSIQIINTDAANFRSSVDEPDFLNTFNSIPGIVRDRKVRLTSGGKSKGELTNRWMKSSPLAKALGQSIDSYYYKNNEPISNAMHRVFMDNYERLYPKEEILSDLAAKGISAHPLRVNVTSYIIDEVPRKDGLLILSASDVCVKKGNVVDYMLVRTSGVLSKNGCQGGQMHNYFRINRMHFDPLCSGRLCKNAKEVSRPYWTERLWPVITKQPPRYPLAPRYPPAPQNAESN